MVKQQLLESLRKAKIQSDRRWVYNLIAWALENQTKDYPTFQRRIQASVHYAKGKYEDYWTNPKNIRQHENAQKRCVDNNKLKYREDSKQYNRQVKLTYKLFRDGKLSKESTTLINKLSTENNKRLNKK